MIQYMASSASSFTDCLELIPESSLPLARLNVCHPRYHIYLLFLSLRVIPRVPTALHLHVAHDNDFTTKLVNCNENYKLYAYPYSKLQEFAVDSEVIVTSHPKIVRKSHA